MELPPKQKIDPELASRAFRMFSAGRYNRLGKDPTQSAAAIFRTANMHGEGLSESEMKVFRSTMNRILTAPLQQPVVGFVETMRAMVVDAEERYTNMEIGSWAVGGFRTFAGIGVNVAKMTNERLRLLGVARVKAQAMTAILMPDGTIDSTVAMLINFLIREVGGDCVTAFLESERGQHEIAVEYALASPTINDWLQRVTEASPKADSQFVIYRCLLSLVKEGVLPESKLESIPGLDMETCQAEEIRLDELSAHTAAWALGRFSGDALACSRYVRGIVELAQQQGKRAAKRQTKFDYARFMIPRFLMEEACSAVDCNE